MMRLGVNIDHIATLREVRRGIEPQPVFAALIAEAAGADSIVAHLREDRRHIKEKDLTLLKAAIKTRLNLEMSIATDIVDIAASLKPDQATLVPERRKEMTTESGLDVVKNIYKIKKVTERLSKKSIEVSLFIDPKKEQVDAAAKTGVKIVELHTGRYADAQTQRDQNRYFRELYDMTQYAKDKGLTVNAGHGLNYYNVARFTKIKGIDELNIGYAIICRAVLVGLDRAVREMKALIGSKST